MKLQTINAAASPEVQMNENFEAADAAGLFGIRRPTTTGLTWGYFGGAIGGSSGLTQVANGTIALTASATNYIEVDQAGAVTKNTSAFTAGSFPLYTVVTSAAGITTITDQRIFIAPLNLWDRLRLSGSVSNANGTGIVFPAAQNASTNVNTLDDYEEGTWTPSLGGSATYTAQVGRYIKVGKLVTVWCRLAVNAIGTGSTTTISGLPFASVSSGINQAGVMGAFADVTHAVVMLQPKVIDNASTITFNELTAAAIATTSNAAIFGDGTTMTFTISYEAAA